MESCFKCGVSESKSLLYDTITSEGIQKICRRCSYHETSPLIKNKDALELKEFESKQDTYERISKVSGFENRKRPNQKNLALEHQESSLRDLVEKNVCKGLNKGAKPRDDLVKNFHWLIKRYRRLKHLTTKQFADALREPEKLIIMAEQGVLPEGYDFVKKVEKLLGIALIKPEVYESLKQREQNISFNEPSELTVADLKEKTKKKGGFFGFFSRKEKVPEEVVEIEEVKEVEVKPELIKETPAPIKQGSVRPSIAQRQEIRPSVSHRQEFSKTSPSPRKDLSKKEIDDLLFGRK